MIKKKICMLGAFAVGKTSLVRQYVHSIFSDKYHTTVGVKIEKTSVPFEDQQVDLIIWDLHGEDDFQHVRLSYLKGSAGCICVADGTREATLATALNLMDIAGNTLGPIPFVLVINKADLKERWEISSQVKLDLEEKGIIVVETSAKECVGVEEVFQLLTREMMSN